MSRSTACPIYLSSFWLYFCWDDVVAHSSAMMGGGVDGICGSDLLFIQCLEVALSCI